MPSLQYQQQIIPLRDGDNLLGGPDADIHLPHLRPGTTLGISVESMGAFAWSSDQSAAVSINGRPLDPGPVPLFHGDRLELNGSPLTFLDENHADVPVADPMAGELPSPRPSAASPEDATSDLDPELLKRVTPPRAGREMVAALRRTDNQRLYVLNRAGFRIGREKRCDLIIPDPSVSRVHAEISLSGDRCLLRNLGRTGTLVNGEPVEEARALRVGDLIQIGKYELAFLRRPADSPDVERALDLTPIRGIVPEAPTVMPAKSEAGNSWVLTLLLALVLAAGAALVLLG